MSEARVTIWHRGNQHGPTALMTDQTHPATITAKRITVNGHVYSRETGARIGKYTSADYYIYRVTAYRADGFMWHNFDLTGQERQASATHDLERFEAQR